jgi:hypothetical protein
MPDRPPDLADKIAARLNIVCDVRNRRGESVHVRDLAKIVRRAIARDRKQRSFEHFMETECLPAWRRELNDAGIEFED